MRSPKLPVVVRLTITSTMVLLALGLTTRASALELNTANRAQLESLRGVGVEGAERILLERDKRSFSDWPDFMRRVKGVKRGMARRFSKAGLTINAAAFEPDTASAIPPPTQPFHND